MQSHVIKGRAFQHRRGAIKRKWSRTELREAEKSIRREEGRNNTLKRRAKEEQSGEQES